MPTLRLSYSAWRTSTASVVSTSRRATRRPGFVAGEVGVNHNNWFVLVSNGQHGHRSFAGGSASCSASVLPLLFRSAGRRSGPSVRAVRNSPPSQWIPSGQLRCTIPRGYGLAMRVTRDSASTRHPVMDRTIPPHTLPGYLCHSRLGRRSAVTAAGLPLAAAPATTRSTRNITTTATMPNRQQHHARNLWQDGWHGVRECHRNRGRGRGRHGRGSLVDSLADWEVSA